MPRNGNNGRVALAEWRGEVSATLKALGEKIDALGDRLTSVEEKQSTLTAKLAVYSAVAGSAVGGVVHYLLKSFGI